MRDFSPQEPQNVLSPTGELKVSRQLPEKPEVRLQTPTNADIYGKGQR
jgi:hypothetical protein